MASKPRNKKWLAILAVAALIFVLAASVGGYSVYTVLDERRNTPTPTVPAYIIVEITATPLPTPAAKCGGPDVMYILLVGSDARSDSYKAGLADAIRIIRVDFVNPSVMMLAFQRDLYVEIPEISQNYGITHGKLNQAYLYGNESFDYYEGPDQGLGLLALTLEHNFGTQVDHAAAVNLQTFVKIIDAVDGIDINLPYAIDGRVKGSTNSDYYFPAGEQHLNGYRTMLLARMRPQGDIERNHIQDLILKAVAKKMIDPAMLEKIPEFVEIFTNSVQTNLTATEIAQLLCLTPMIQTENIRTVSFPDELFKSKRINDPILGNTSILEVDFNILRTYVQEFKNGTWPETIPQP